MPLFLIYCAFLYNVRQRKLGIIIIQTVHILHHYIAVTGAHCPMGNFRMGNPMYFKLT
jgi:hypothetical protein